MLSTKYCSLCLSFVILQVNPFGSEFRQGVTKIASNQKVIELTGEKAIKLKVKLSAFRFELKKNIKEAVDITIKGTSPIPEIKETKNKVPPRRDGNSLTIDISGGVSRQSSGQSYTYFLQSIKNKCDILMPNVPLDLDISVSGNSSSLDFSGLSVASLKLLTGGNSKVSFPTPNSVKCKKFYIYPKFSNFKGEWLGNANADNYYFSAGAGNYTLDFRGEIKGRKNVEISVGMGMLKLVFSDSSLVRLKSNGVYVKSTKKLAKQVHLIDENGWYIYNSEISKSKTPMANEFIVHIEGSLGIVEIEFL